MSAVQKIIIVGEPETGKTSIIKEFLNYEAEGVNKSTVINSMSDFSMKIIKIDGEKARLQLWDQGSGKDTTSVFQPLFVRHTAGCIVVANTINKDTIRKAPQWKAAFDAVTKIQDEPAYPCTLFINHHDAVPVEDHQKLRNFEQLAGEEGTFDGIYHVSTSDPGQIYKVFESFVSSLIDPGNMQQRTTTENFLVDENGNQTIKIRKSQHGNRGSMYAAGGGVRGPNGEEGEDTFSQNQGADKFDPRADNIRLSKNRLGSITGSNRKRQCRC